MPWESAARSAAARSRARRARRPRVPRPSPGGTAKRRGGERRQALSGAEERSSEWMIGIFHRKVGFRSSRNRADSCLIRYLEQRRRGWRSLARRWIIARSEPEPGPTSNRDHGPRVALGYAVVAIAPAAVVRSGASWRAGRAGRPAARQRSAVSAVVMVCRKLAGRSRRMDSGPSCSLHVTCAPPGFHSCSRSCSLPASLRLRAGRPVLRPLPRRPRLHRRPAHRRRPRLLPSRTRTRCRRTRRSASSGSSLGRRRATDATTSCRSIGSRRSSRPC